MISKEEALEMPKPDQYAGKGEKLGFGGAFETLASTTQEQTEEKAAEAAAIVQQGVDLAEPGSERSVLCLTTADGKARAQITFETSHDLQKIVTLLLRHVSMNGVPDPLPWSSKTELEDAIADLAGERQLPPGVVNYIMTGLGLNAKAARGRAIDAEIAKYNALSVGEKVKLDMSTVRTFGMHFCEYLESAR